MSIESWQKTNRKGSIFLNPSTFAAHNFAALKETYSTSFDSFKRPKNIYDVGA